jgi:hypothetical protein
MIPPLDQAQEILAQDLKHHANVCAIGAFVLEGIQKADDMFSARVIWFGGYDLVEQLDFVYSGFGVVCCGPHDLQGDVLPRNIISGKPDCREVTPAQLAHHGIFPILELLTNGDGMIAALAVVLGVLFIGSRLGGVFS